MRVSYSLEDVLQDKCVQNQSVHGQVRNQPTRNRKRSRRRAIYCPTHGCYLDSVSQKYPLYADRPEQLRSRGVSRRSSRLVLAGRTTVPLEGEWLEAFWCSDCAATTWYYVRRTGDRTYAIAPAPQDLWQQVHGVIHPHGNPSVSEFTRKQARCRNKIKNFGAMR
jgi:hypothetical protein